MKLMIDVKEKIQEEWVPVYWATSLYATVRTPELSLQAGEKVRPLGGWDLLRHLGLGMISFNFQTGVSYIDFNWDFSIFVAELSSE